MKRSTLFVLGMALAAGGCVVSDDVPATGEATSDVRLTGAFRYDGGTSCVVGGVRMHCCPTGMVMIGAHLDRNVFKCATVLIGGGVPPFSGDRFADTTTTRNTIHSCPIGSVMVGYHKDRDILACQRPTEAAQPPLEFTDGNPPTADSFPMHVCPLSFTTQFVMTGIDSDRNLFNCDV